MTCASACAEAAGGAELDGSAEGGGAALADGAGGDTEADGAGTADSAGAGSGGTEADGASEQALKTAELEGFELYNLKHDIAEATDLSAREPQRLQEMKAQMQTLYDAVRDESPVWPAWKWPRYEAQRIKWPPYSRAARRQI